MHIEVRVELGERAHKRGPCFDSGNVFRSEGPLSHPDRRVRFTHGGLFVHPLFDRLIIRPRPCDAVHHALCRALHKVPMLGGEVFQPIVFVRIKQNFVHRLLELILIGIHPGLHVFGFVFDHLHCVFRLFNILPQRVPQIARLHFQHGNGNAGKLLNRVDHVHDHHLHTRRVADIAEHIS